MCVVIYNCSDGRAAATRGMCVRGIVAAGNDIIALISNVCSNLQLQKWRPGSCNSSIFASVRVAMLQAMTCSHRSNVFSNLQLQKSSMFLSVQGRRRVAICMYVCIYIYADV